MIEEAGEHAPRPLLFGRRPGGRVGTAGVWEERLKTKIVLAALAAALPLASAEAMNVAEFLQKAAVLEKKGMMALFSSDLKILKKEVQTAGSQLRAERLSVAKAGRKPSFCPPEKTDLTAEEILAHLKAIPVPQRPGMQVKDGLRGLLVRKYPCQG